MFSMRFALIGAAMCLIAGPSLAQEAYPATNLKVQGGWATGGLYTEYEVPFWKERIPKLSNGRITAHLTTLNEMGLKGPEVFRLLKVGVVDFGTSVLGYVAGDHPENEGADIAGAALDAKTARAAVEAWRPTLDKLYVDKYGVKPIIFYPAEAQAFFCNADIKGLDDLKGKKVRTSTASAAAFVQAIGGVSITMAFSEVVPALQRKVIDCAITGTFSGNSAKWYEVATHLYPLPLGWSVFMYAAGTQSWNQFNPKVRELLESELKKLENEMWEGGAYRTQQGIDCNTGKATCEKGTKQTMTLVPVTEADAAKAKKIIEQNILPDWAKRCGATCTQQWNETVGKALGMTAKM
jgi:TRAP-type C4-dicarboxylate transport system substrate-binding protein